MEKNKIAIIIGAGPAGLTAAFELQQRTSIKPIIFESTETVGGISKTINYNGNRIDIGGHRFFSKSKTVMDWWLNILPLEESDEDVSWSDPQATKERAKPELVDSVMLIRNRLSRIYYLRKFFEYPISLNASTISKLGLRRTIEIGFSYLWSSLFPRKNEISLEDFLINRFGNQLYRTFFKDYTEKVWGIPCNEIDSSWGAQRIKGLSIRKALLHALSQMTRRDQSLAQRNVETSLISRFLYPKLGPGQLWEEVARRVIDKGGELHMKETVIGVEVDSDLAVNVTTLDASGRKKKHEADFVISTMPVKELIAGISPAAPENVRRISDGLMYRDFITVGVLAKKLSPKAQKMSTIKDNWIYVQDPEVKMGRIQIFNNWSPYLVKNKDTVWLGLEYFCNEGDELWRKNDEEFAKFAIGELAQMDMIELEDVLDSTTIRVPKTYPGYFGTYSEFSVIENYVNTIENLFLIGRNGMHRYNNQDHSMLTAIAAVENIVEGRKDKTNIWAVNTEKDYHEEQ